MERKCYPKLQKGWSELFRNSRNCVDSELFPKSGANDVVRKPSRGRVAAGDSRIGHRCGDRRLGPDGRHGRRHHPRLRSCRRGERPGAMGACEIKLGACRGALSEEVSDRGWESRALGRACSLELLWVTWAICWALAPWLGWDDWLSLQKLFLFLIKKMKVGLSKVKRNCP
jgi:hypothetical protein